jgi:hypothetical protein
MAGPCVLYNGKKYTTEEFAAFIHDGELSNLISSNKLDPKKLTGEIPDVFNVTVVEPVNQMSVITPEKSSNFANLTQDEEGNAVFFHVGDAGYETIKPSSGQSTRTSRDEAAAIGKVGGVAMYYTRPEDGETMVKGPGKYAVKVPIDKVYDFNTDENNYLEEAEKRHEAENPGKAFDANSQLAYITKIAGENGYDMVVADWGGKTRAQTTKELTPTDTQVSKGEQVTKTFDEEYKSNTKKGFVSIVPESKDSKFQKIYDKIYKYRNSQQNYDALYKLSTSSLSREEITKLVNESDLPQDLKDEYNKVDKQRQGKRRSYMKTEVVTVEGAPEGNYLNIGMEIGKDGEMLTIEEIKEALPDDVEISEELVKDVESNFDGKISVEPTTILKISRPLTDAEMQNLLVATEQMGISQMVDGQGIVHGTELWGKFDPKFFHMPDSRVLSDVVSKEKTIEQEVEEISNLFSTDINKAVENAKAALANILPNVKFVIHDSYDSYTKAVGDEDVESGGTYMSSTNTIHINKRAATKTTVAHEVFHAVLINMVGTDVKAADITKRMINALSKQLDNNPDLKEYLENFIASYDENIKNEEKAAELFGYLAANYDTLPKQSQNLIKRWMDALAKMFGFKPFTDNEVVDFFNTLSEKVATGQEVTQSDVDIIGVKGNINTRNVTSRKSIIGDVDLKRFPVNKNTDLKENIPLSEFKGKKSNIIESDRLTGAYISDENGSPLFKFFGGLYYPVITGKWWASSNKATANKISKNQNKNRDADGYVYSTPIIMGPESHMSNVDMFNAVWDFMKYDLRSKSNNVTKELFNKYLDKAFSTQKLSKKYSLLNIKKSDSINDVISKLDDAVFSDRSSFTFEERKTLIKSLLGNPNIGSKRNFPSAGSISELAKKFEEPNTKKANKQWDIVMVMRTKGDLSWKETPKYDEFYHNSYPFEISSSDKIEVFFLDGAYNITDVYPELTKSTGDVFSWKEYLSKHSKISERFAVSQYGRTGKLSMASGNISGEIVDRKQLSVIQEKDLSSSVKKLTDQERKDLVSFIKDKEYKPKKTVKAYKLFRVNKRDKGQLFPLFVHADKAVPFNYWVKAAIGEEVDKTKTGNRQVKSKLGPLAFRPGWHSGDLPLATHIGDKINKEDKAPSVRPSNQVWAEIEVSDDFDWQSEATSRAEKTKAGGINLRTAHITDRLPDNGYYKYKTNSNMTGSWLISGEMKVNRILSDEEVVSINNSNNTSDLIRITPFDKDAYGFNSKGYPESSETNDDNIILEFYRDSVRNKETNKVVDLLDSKAPGKKQTSVISNKIKAAKQAGFSDAAISQYLQNNGYTAEQASKGLLDYNKKEIQKAQKEEGIFLEDTGSKFKNYIGKIRRTVLSARGFKAISQRLGLEERTANIEYQLKMVSNTSKKFDRLLRKFQGDKEKLISDFDLYLRGDNSVNIPSEFKALADIARNQIDGLTDMLIRYQAIPGESAENIRANIGSYMNRAYEIFNNKDWSKKVKEEVVESAKDFFRTQLLSIATKNAMLSGRSINDEVLNSINEIQNKTKQLDKLIVEYNKSKSNQNQLVDKVKEISDLMTKYGFREGKEILDYVLSSGNNINTTKISDKIDSFFKRVSVIKNSATSSKTSGIDLKTQLERDVNDQINRILNKDTGNNFINSGNEGSKDLSILKRRLEIPLEIRALMGEYTDPIQNYANTVNKLANLVYNAKYLTELKEKGLGTIFFEKGDANTPDNFKEEIASKSTKTLDPLGGLYTSKELKKAFEKEFTPLDELSEAASRFSIYRYYMKTLRFIKKSKTIQSLGTHMKNVLGAFEFALSNGHVDFKEYANAYKVIMNDVKNKGNKYLEEKMLEYIKSGVITQNVALGEIKSMFKDDDFEKAFERRMSMANESKVSRLLKGARSYLNKLDKKLIDVYQAEDNLFKIIGFEIERKRYADIEYDKKYDQLTDDQKKDVDRIVSENIKNILPNYDRIPELGKFFKVIPIAATFISFELESIRTSYNTVSLAFSEMKSDNPKSKKLGATRFAALAATQGFRYFLKYMLGSAAFGWLRSLGDDDEEEANKRAKRFTPDYTKNSMISIVDMGKGKFSYIDLDASNPRSKVPKMLEAFTSGEDPSSMLINLIEESVSTFVSNDILVNKIGNLKNNEDDFGNPIFNKYDTPFNIGKDIINYSYDVFMPGTGTSIKKIYKSDNQVAAAVGQATGYRITDVEIEKQYYFKAKKTSEEVRKAKDVYDDAFYKYEKGELTREELDESYIQANRSVEFVLGEAKKDFDAAVFFGANPDALDETLSKVRMSESDQIMSGEFEPIESKIPLTKEETVKKIQELKEKARSKKINLDDLRRKVREKGGN